MWKIKNLYSMKTDKFHIDSPKEYWDHRFKSEDWGTNGRIQTLEYAKANLKSIGLSSDFNGSVLDFGCTLGDAVAIYSNAFPNAKLLGVDISEAAIEKCREKYGDKAEWLCVNYTNIPFADVIIASHVMEHIIDDKVVINALIKKCSDLFVFVPYKENPLYFEHVHSYNEFSYKDLNVFEQKIFKVSFKTKNRWTSVLKILLKTFRFELYNNFTKDIIMFHFKGMQTSGANRTSK